MLVAVNLSALVRVRFELMAVGASVVVAAVCIVAGGYLRRWVRKESFVQLGASTLLAVVGAPALVLGGQSLTATAVIASTWAAIFLAVSLVVRAILARHHGQRSALAIDAIAIAVPGLTAALLFVNDQARFAAAALCAAGLATAMAALRPTPKHLKPVGIAAAALSTVSAVLLAL